MVARRATFSVPGVGSKSQVVQGPVELDLTHPLARGLQGFWLLTGGNLVDLTGKHAAASPAGSSTGYDDSYYGQALRLGTASWITLGSTISYTAFSIVLPSIIFGLVPAYAAIFTRRVGSAGKAYQIAIKSDGSLQVYTDTSGGFVFYDGTGTYRVTTGTATHLGATYDQTTGLVGYVNAKVDATIAANGTADTTAGSNTLVGNDPFDLVNRYVDSSVPCIAIYDRAISAAEVLWHSIEPFAMLRPIWRRTYLIPFKAPLAARPLITVYA